VPWANGGPDPTREANSSIHAYFPTDEELGRGILVHGDFVLQSNRRHIQDSDAGGDVSRLVAEAVAESVGLLATTVSRESPTLLAPLLACLIKRTEPQGYGRTVAKLIDQDLARRPIVPTLSGQFVTPGEARLMGA